MFVIKGYQKKGGQSMASKVIDVAPLREDGYRLFNIGQLAKAMGRSRKYVETLIIQPGFPYFPLLGYENPGYLECEVCKWMRDNVRYVHQV